MVTNKVACDSAASAEITFSFYGKWSTWAQKAVAKSFERQRCRRQLFGVSPTQKLSSLWTVCCLVWKETFYFHWCLFVLFSCWTQQKFCCTSSSVAWVISTRTLVRWAVRRWSFSWRNIALKYSTHQESMSKNFQQPFLPSAVLYLILWVYCSCKSNTKSRK